MIQVLHLSFPVKLVSRLLVDINPIYYFSSVAEFHLIIWDVFHKTILSLFFFVVGVPTTPFDPSPKDAFSNSFVAEDGICFSILLFQLSIFYSFIPEASWGWYFQPIFSDCQDHVLIVLILLTGVLCPLLKFFSPYRALHLFSTGVQSEIFLTPCSIHSIVPEAIRCVFIKYLLILSSSYSIPFLFNRSAARILVFLDPLP